MLPEFAIPTSALDSQEPKLLDAHAHVSEREARSFVISVLRWRHVNILAEREPKLECKFY